MKSPVPDAHVLPHEGFWVVRDDMLLGGSKRRALPACFEESCSEYVFCAPAVGSAQLALALACADFGFQATVFTAKRNHRHHYTALAASYGAQVFELAPGRLSQVEKAGRDYCAQTGALRIPLGLADPRVEQRMSEEAASVAQAAEVAGVQISDVWCAVGAGMLARSLGRAFPAARIHCVAVGRKPKPDDLPPGAEVYYAPEEFEKPARVRPPWPSASHYDAKIWQFALRVPPEHRQKHLIWNVA